MRNYDIPYVQNPLRSSSPVKELKDLTLQELTKHYLCGKSQGKVSECLRCPAPCAYGKRAVELALPNNTYFAEPKTYHVDGKTMTMIEAAKADTAKQREQKAEKKELKEKKGKKNKLPDIPDWYDKAYESGEPVKWIMDNFHITERQAKQKVYSYQYSRPGLKEAKPMWESQKKPEDQAETPAPKPAETPEASGPEEPFAPLEDKITALMNKQDEYKAEYERYLRLYEGTKKKVDALYEALTILNEG